jgi:Na+/proline symporter
VNPSILPPPPLAVAIPLSRLQYAILGGYFSVLLGIAFAFRRFNRDGDDYFRSGSRGPWWLVGMSTFMSSFSAYTFTGLAGAAYIAGLSATSNFIANVIGFALNGLFLAAWLRQLRVTTMPEVIRDRFGPAAEQLYSWVGNFFGILYAAITLYTLCIFASTVFGLRLVPTIVGVGLVVMTYSLLGGRWAVMGADFVKGMILLPVTMLLAFLCLQRAGGWHGLFQAIAAQGLSHEFAFFKEPRADLNYNFTAPWVAASILYLLMDRLSLSAAPRYFSCRDGRHASKAGWLVSVLMLGSTVAFFLPPIVGRLFFRADIEAVAIPQPAEASYAIVSLHLLPEALMGLMVVAIFSSTLSTMDTGLNLFSAVFAKNIYPALCRSFGKREAIGAGLVKVGELLTLGSGIGIILIACYFAESKGQGAFDIMLELGALLGLPMNIPLVLGLFVTQAPRRAALWSMVPGFSASIYGYLTARSAIIASWSGVWSYDKKVFITLAWGSAGFLLARFFCRDSPESRGKTAAFYRRMHTPVDFEAEVGSRGDDGQEFRVLGWFSTVVGIGIILLVIAPEPWAWGGRLGTLAIGLLQLCIGWVLRRNARRVAASPHPPLPGLGTNAEPAGRDRHEPVT